MPNDYSNIQVTTADVPAVQESAPVLTVETEVVPELQAAPAENQEATPESTPEDQKPEHKGFLRKIDKMTAKLSQRDEELMQLRREVEALRTPKKEIDLDELSVDDRIAYLAEKKIQDYIQQQRVQSHAHAQAQSAQQAWDSRVDAILDKHPDYNEVLESADFPMPPQVLDAIQNSDHGPELAYELASNPELATKIARLDPISQAKMLFKLEAKFEAAPASVTPKVVVPVTTTPGRPAAPNVNKKPVDMSMAELIAHRKQNGTLSRR